jgi:hypothetical protein
MVHVRSVKGPRINVCLVSPTHGLFFTVEERNMNSRKTYLQHIQYNELSTYVWRLKQKKALLWVVARHARMQTSLHTSPML